MPDTIFGRNLDEARRLWFAASDIAGAPMTWSVNATATFDVPLGVPPGVTKYRILGVHVKADAVPADANGVMELSLDARDVSEGAWDSIVSSEDLEALIANTDEWFEATLAAEGSGESERTLSPGDTFRVQLVNDSAEIDTNANVAICIEVIPLPQDIQDEDEDPPFVHYESEYGGPDE